jgi:hypothetical protein
LSSEIGANGRVSDEILVPGKGDRGISTQSAQSSQRGGGAARLAGGQPRVIFGFAIERGKIVSIDLVADAERLQQSELKLLED